MKNATAMRIATRLGADSPVSPAIDTSMISDERTRSVRVAEATILLSTSCGAVAEPSSGRVPAPWWGSNFRADRTFSPPSKHR